jgi:hypothetical protein
MRLPGSNRELRLEHRFLRRLEAEILDERQITFDEFLNKRRLEAATLLVQVGRQWEDPDITEEQADDLIQQAKNAGLSFGMLYGYLLLESGGQRVTDVKLDNLGPQETATKDAGEVETGKKSEEGEVVGSGRLRLPNVSR